MSGRPSLSAEGRVWLITGPDGKLMDDIDTDMIYHNAHLAVTEVSEMGRYAFGNLEGWRDFPEKVRPGDIVIAGANFGCGSSRQHAVDCFRALGVGALVVESAGAIYFRNAVNSAFPLVIAPGIGESGIKQGDVVTIDFETGLIKDLDRPVVFRARPFSAVQREIYLAGSLFAVRPS